MTATSPAGSPWIYYYRITVVFQVNIKKKKRILMILVLMRMMMMMMMMLAD